MGVDLFNPLASVVVFQCNPNTMTRRLEARAAGGDGDPEEALRLSCPLPTQEDITLSIEIDAPSQLEDPNPMATQLGIDPRLAALEMMLYPKSEAVIANTVLSLVGSCKRLAQITFDEPSEIEQGVMT